MKTLYREYNPDRIKKSYSKAVWIYNIWARLTESRAAARVLKLAGIHDRQHVLEVACGTGVVFENILHQNPNGENLGIDLSTDMLNKARKRMQKAGLRNYRLEELDFLKSPLPGNSFDVLINNFMVDLLPESEFDKIASEFYRILKPNGIAVVSTFSFGEKKIHRFWYWIAKHFPGLLTDCRPVSFRKHLENAGFRIAEDIFLSQNSFPAEIIKAVKQLTPSGK